QHDDQRAMDNVSAHSVDMFRCGVDLEDGTNVRYITAKQLAKDLRKHKSAYNRAVQTGNVCDESLIDALIVIDNEHLKTMERELTKDKPETVRDLMSEKARRQ